MKKLFYISVSMILFGLLCTQALAGIPQCINYQGKLTDSYGGLICDTTVDIRFRIYANSTGGTALWDTTYSSVQITNGLFSVLLCTIPETVFNGSIRYLGITVGDDGESTPRMPIVSVGYAYRALRADTTELCITYADSDWVIADTNIYRDVGQVAIGTDSCGIAKFTVMNGDVGIGTNIPTSRLQVEVEEDSANALNVNATGTATIGVSASAGGGYTSGGKSIAVRGMAIGGINGRDEIYGGFFLTSPMYSANKNFGIWAHGSASSSDTTYGVYARGSGEWSDATFGVYGIATCTTGVAYGVYGDVPTGISGYAGYFNGEKSYFSGKVGIGIESPIYDLDVADDARVSDNLIVTGRGLVIESGDPIIPGEKLYVNGSAMVKDTLRVDDRLEVEGPIQFEFDFESDWTDINTDECVTVYHYLGGDPSKYIVFLTGKSSSGGYIHQKNYGTNYRLGWRGCEWGRLTSSSIRVCRGADDDDLAPYDDWNEFKIRIIKNQ